MWLYKQSSGEFWHDNKFVGTGYSGADEARNNPDMEDVPMMGPIPRGKYHIWPSRFSERLGPVVMNLTPEGHDACGRTDFRIHGDSQTHDASHGCIILNRPIRELIAASNDTTLEVV